MNYTKVYHRTYEAIGRTERFVSSCGGTRSGKTIANLQLIYQLALMRPCLISVVSETFPHLKRGAIRDFSVALGDLWDDSCWSKGDSIYTLPNGSRIEFFSADAPSKVHGPARDHLFLNEAQNIPYEIARQLFVRTRGLIILDYNPTHDGWMQQKVESRPECVTIHSTYEDNDFLTPEQVREIEANKGDANWWRVYGLGLVGTLEGLIYPDFELIDAMPEDAGLKEVYGMDFGFTHDPTAIVRVLADTGRKVAYIEQICYQTGMLNADIAAVLKGREIARQVDIWADAAEPKSIAEIAAATGLRVLACDKSAPVKSDRLKFQLQWMQGWRLCVVKSSLDLIHELRNYCWAKDRDGNLTNAPIDLFNHCFVGSTKIATPTGDKPMRRIKPGDFVLTSKGPRKVLNKWNNGRKKILLLSIKFVNFEIVMRATPDHKIKTTKGWKQLQNIKAGDTLYVSRSLMEKFTDSTQGSDISAVGQIGCTASCGSSTTALFRRAGKFITRTATRIITILQTLFASRTTSTRPNIEKKASPVESPKKGLQISTRLWRPRRNGTEAMPGTNGTPTTPANNGKGRKNGRRSAIVAGRYSDTGQSKSRASAQTPANQSGAGMPGLTTKPGTASFAAESSEQTTTPILVPAPVLAVQNIGGRSGTRKRLVYDITIEDCHEYIANGVLVHNCMDAMRYALWTEFAQHPGYGEYSVSFKPFKIYR